MKLFKAVKKAPDEFCAKSMPWKSTNGVVCSDHYTQEDAEKEAQRQNRIRKGR